MTFARPLDAFPLVRTQSIEELRAALARIYVKPLLDPVERDRTLQAIQNHCQLQHIGVSYGSYGIGVRFRFTEPRITSQIFPIRGKAEVLVDGTPAAIDPDRSAVIGANASTFDMVSNAKYERLILLVDDAALTMKLAALVGNPVYTSPRFHPEQNFTQPSAHILRANFMFLVSQLNAGTLFPPLVLAEFEQMLMVTFLHANRHDYSHLLERVPSDAALQQVRRAEEFIEANWNKPMNLEAIAAATEVSVRSLFRYFRRSRGYSPMEFLKRVRLQRARALLRRPAVATTVREIAFACGFAEVERFSRDYLREFGERPSDTLARAGGPGLAPH